MIPLEEDPTRYTSYLIHVPFAKEVAVVNVSATGPKSALRGAFWSSQTPQDRYPELTLSRNVQT
jgi:hypothetical protein